MNESTKTTIVSLLTSFVMLAAGIPAFASFLTPDMVAKLQTGIPTIVGGLFTVIMTAMAIYKALPKSSNSVLKSASEQPGVRGIVADPAIADSPALKDNPKIVGSPAQLPPEGDKKL